MNYYMGIDVGTFETKGMLIDGNGNCIATHSQSHQMESPQTGYAEHDAENTWWSDFCKVSKALINKADIQPSEIKGVGCSAIGPCCLPVDEECRPLRKAILYGVDVRAKKQIDYLNKKLGEENILKRYGNPITSQSIGPKILWIKENEPEIYKATYKFITASTYLVAKLTGKFCIDHYTASYFTPMYNLEDCDWDKENISEFCDPDQLAECMWTDEIAGYVNEAAAVQTGLAVGTPVTTGTADASADAVGVGVFDPGDMLIMFGSSVYMIHVVPQLTVDSRYWAGPYLFKNTFMVASGMSTTGTLTRWFRDQLAPDLLEKQGLGEGDAYELLLKEITDIPSGSEGLVVLPYFSGERTPINDPSAKGVFFGLTLHHTRAHLYQACLEGVGYGIAQHLKGYDGIRMKTNRIIAVGGGTKSQKWMQIVSDITRRELMLGDIYGAAFGDALLAALATGHFSSIKDISNRIRFRGKITPNEEKGSIYQKYLSIYTKLYEQTKDLMHNL